jgi:hypothetical protein
MNPTIENLHAAALDLYKAARAAAIIVNNFRPDGCIAADLRAAICKAEGRDPVSGLTLDAPAAPIAPKSPAIAPQVAVPAVFITTAQVKAAAPAVPVFERPKLVRPQDRPFARFEVGKEYYVRSIGDADCIYRFKVIARTAKQVTLLPEHEKTPIKRGIDSRVTDYSNEETCMPHGRYSMAACLHADRVVPENGIIP